MSRYKPNIKKCYGSKNRKDLYKGRPVKFLTKRIHKNGGRNNLGRLTCRSQGGGIKHRYRIIDFKRQKDNMPAKVLRLEYDPNRTAFIALIEYEDGHQSYIIAPKDLKVGDSVMSGEDIEVQTGNCLPLEKIPQGSFIHNIELHAGKGGILGRSAGSKIMLSGKETGYAILKMNSGEMRKISLKSRATVGIVSNVEHVHSVIGKAGRSRLLNKRPKNRGIARNPVDHPNGGRSNGGKIFANITGRVIKGKKTRNKKKAKKNKLIIRRIN